MRCAERRRQRRHGLSSIDLLMPALRRAFALEEVHDVAVRVGEDLDLDVPRPLDQPLDVERAVAERRLRLAPRCASASASSPRRAHRLHPDAAAARRRLDQRREADARRPRPSSASSD